MKNITYTLVVFSLFLCCWTIRDLDKTSFYEALSSGSEKKIEAEIAKLNNTKTASLTNAYLGALLMKKAGFLKGAGAKVKAFKKGAGLLEEEINANPANPEYRFIRLTIQEHAPAILKYNKNKAEDKKVIMSAFGDLEPDLQRIIKDYSRSSKVIKVDDLR